MKPVQSCRLAFAVLLLLSLSSVSCHATTEYWNWIEQSWLMSKRTQAKTKPDIGALTSSLDMKNIYRYKKDGERWVRPDVVLSTTDSKAPVSVTFERKVLRLVKMCGVGGSDSHPVVATDICLGVKLLREQFSLHDRSNVNYPILLGRRMLEYLGAVDVSRTFTRKPICGVLAAQQKDSRGSPMASTNRGSMISAIIHGLHGHASPSRAWLEVRALSRIDPARVGAAVSAAELGEDRRGQHRYQADADIGGVEGAECGVLPRIQVSLETA